MKKYIKSIIFIMTLFVLSIIVVLHFGETYTLSFNVNNDNYEFFVENVTGAVDIIDSKRVDDKYIVKVKSKMPGTVYIGMNYDGLTTMSVLYIHKSMVITENSYFGKSTCSEVIPISIFLVLIYILYLLIKKYKYNVKDNLYQYKNIAYLGMIIYILSFMLSIFRSIFLYQGLDSITSDIIGLSTTISIILLPIAFITFLLVTISNIDLIRKEGMSLRNLLGLFLGIFICAFTFLPDIMYKMLMVSQKFDIYNLNGPGPYIYNFVETLVYLVVAYLECILIGTIILAIKSVKKKPKYDKDYIIILGCQLKKDGKLTPLLKGRVDKAIEFRNEQLEKAGKDLIFIPSGGQGSDEIISEAEAIKNYLLVQGIKEKNIIIEDKSTSTYENIKFSNKLAKKGNICFSTTNYHVLRAGLIATEQNLKLEGIGSKTKTYFWINAFIREFIGTLYKERKKHILVFSILVIIILIMIIITYFTNNIH